MLHLRVKTMPCVKIFLEVTSASVNSDILDETVKRVSLVALKSFIRNSNFHFALHLKFLKSFQYQNTALNLYFFYLDINECAGSPCKNGATCQNIPGSYLCRCNAGFTGRNCNSGQLAHSLFNSNTFLQSIYPFRIMNFLQIRITNFYRYLQKDLISLILHLKTWLVSVLDRF